MFLRSKGCPSEPNIAKLYSLRNVLLTSSIKSQGLDHRRCSQTPRRSTSSCFSLLGMSAPGTLRNFVVHSEERKTFERAQPFAGPRATAEPAHTLRIAPSWRLRVASGEYSLHGTGRLRGASLRLVRSRG